MRVDLNRGIGDVERLRVAQHILRAEAYAGRRRVRLPPLKRLARQLLLRELAVYRAKGRFPKNRDFSRATPYFVDAEGTRCAVAHLLDASGETELVQRVAHQRNHARVAELANEAQLVVWLDVAGLSLEEAALIQPSYSRCLHQGGCICGAQTSGYFEATVLNKTSTDLLNARVDAIHGSPSAAINVGDQVLVSARGADVGTELVLLGDGERSTNDKLFFHGITFPVSCGQEAPKLNKEQYLAAVLSDDCQATLDTYGDWPGTCGGGGDGLSCRAVGRGSPSTLGIVLSLLGLAVARRMQREAR